MDFGRALVSVHPRCIAGACRDVGARRRPRPSDDSGAAAGGTAIAGETHRQPRAACDGSCCSPSGAGDRIVADDGNSADYPDGGKEMIPRVGSSSLLDHGPRPFSLTPDLIVALVGTASSQNQQDTAQNHSAFTDLSKRAAEARRHSARAAGNRNSLPRPQSERAPRRACITPREWRRCVERIYLEREPGDAVLAGVGARPLLKVKWPPSDQRTQYGLCGGGQCCSIALSPLVPASQRRSRRGSESGSDRHDAYRCERESGR